MSAKVGDAWLLAQALKEPEAPQPPKYLGMANRTPECVWVFENIDALFGHFMLTVLKEVKQQPDGDGSKFSAFCSSQYDQEKDRIWEQTCPPDGGEEDTEDDDEGVPW